MPANGRWDLTRRVTYILLTWRILRAPNNASRWQMEFNWALKGSMPKLGMRGAEVLLPHTLS